MPHRTAHMLLQKATRAVSVILLAGVVFLGASVPGHAAFVGVYDVSNWTEAIPLGGAIDTSGAPNSIMITEPGEIASATMFTIAAAASGQFSFDWTVENNADGARLDVFVGSATPFVSCTGTSCAASSDGIGGTLVVSDGSGSMSFSVVAGETIGWSAVNTNGINTAKWTISNFSAPVPVPPALFLFASALVTFFGVGRVRRQRSAKAA